MEPGRITFGDSTITNAEGTRSTPSNLDLSVFGVQQTPNVANRLQSSIATDQTPIQEQEPEFTIDVDQEITSDLLSDTTPQEVFDQRAGLEAQAATIQATQDATTNAQQFLDTEDSLFTDLTNEIISSLNADPTETEVEYQNLLTNFAEELRQIDESLSAARERGERDTGIFALQKELNQTNVKIAKRQTALRRRLRDFDRSAEARGVARQFVQDERRKIEADATAELADLYIIQNAQQGNVQAAQNYINTAVENKYKNIETELAARQFELQAAESRLEGEAKDENLRLQIALTERQNQIADRKEQEKSIREFAITAAQNGAPFNLVEQILQSGNVDAGLAVASPYIGRYERMKAQSSLETARLARRKSLVELALQGDETAYDQLGSFGQSLKNQIAELKSKEETEQYLQNVAASTGLEERITRYSANTLDNDAGFRASVGGTALGRSSLFTREAFLTGGLGALKVATQKADFLSTATEMVNIAGFDTLIDYKAQGATFGALSEKEFNAIKSASGPLAAYAIINDEGRVTGFRGSDEQVRNAFSSAIQELSDQQKELDSQFVDSSEKAAIINATK